MLILMFGVGVLEMVIISAWTKSVTEQRLFTSGFLTIINVSIWYFILRVIIEHINSVPLFAVYAVGCSLGTMIEILLGRRKK